MSVTPYTKPRFTSPPASNRLPPNELWPSGGLSFVASCSSRHGRAPEFACSGNQRVVQQFLSLQICKASGAGLIQLAEFCCKCLIDAAVMVPALICFADGNQRSSHFEISNCLVTPRELTMSSRHGTES